MKRYFGAFLTIFILVTYLNSAFSASAGQLNRNATHTITNFYNQIPDGRNIFSRAKGALIFPAVYKAGFGIGGEYGEGVLRIHGKTVAYYSTVAASIGFQLGAQKKSILILFMDDRALRSFRDSDGFKIGIDASVAIITLGVGGSIDTEKLNKPIIAFVLDQKGLMYNVSLEGAKITRIHK